MSKGPKNTNAEALLAEAAAEAVAHDEDLPAVPAQEPVSERVTFSDIFNQHYRTILPAVIGFTPNDQWGVTNATEKGRIREKLIDTALSLTLYPLRQERVTSVTPPTQENPE